MSVCVRFAPSPTGFLHIGGARTALFNWLYARHTGGVFILRIEDTDLARNTPEAIEVILNGLRWLGLDWDEGPLSGNVTGPSKGERGPYFQSQRRHIYQKRVQELVDKGMAYEDDGAVKFKMPRAPVVISDLVVGQVKRELTDREQADPDFVIVRSDGQPVFHLVNVIDDMEMGITHVIRGEDHLANTAKHIVLFRAFGIEPPQYAHLPLILNKDGSKMSKRDQGASLTTYMEEGYVPEAVVNYLLLLGWWHKGDREVLPLSEAIETFDLPQILRHNARFDLSKLQWLNGEYARSMPPKRFREFALKALHKAGLSTNAFSEKYLDDSLATCHGKIKLFSEIPAYAGFYYADEVAFDAQAAKQNLTPENKPRLLQLREALGQLTAFDADTLQNTLKTVAAVLGVKPAVLVHPMRVACTGKTIGPSLYHLMEVLGKGQVLQRLDRAIESCVTCSAIASNSRRA
jgi:glutamyl-tRNA synthetase